MSRSQSSQNMRPWGAHVRPLVLVVVLAVLIVLVCVGYEVSAAISAVAACALLTEDICRRLGWVGGPRAV
ncbi:hypothetical protein [Streptomyces sp. AC550_RSS872]|uniref:hypothetical protein n=1 Tax=Streptomyces sp. AC550_RSS872 TaxID=2823689 RepID=UPI001C27DA28|nr:hypothetical protein [Streptomyces sp. AC550_RSS872]